MDLGLNVFTETYFSLLNGLLVSLDVETPLFLAFKYPQGCFFPEHRLVIEPIRFFKWHSLGVE